MEEHIELKQLVLQVGILILILATGNMIKSALDAYIKRMQGPFEDDFNLRMLKKRLYVDYDVLESKKFNDDAHAVFDSLYRNNSVMRDGSMIWQRFLTATAGLVLYSAILMRQSIVAVLLVWVPALLILGLKERAAAYDEQLRPKADKASRKMKYVEECACDLAGGKDIRMHDLAGWLTAIFHREQATADGYVKHWENGYFAVNICDAVLCFIRDFGIYFYFIWKIINGDMAVFRFCLSIQRLRQAVKRHAAHFLTAEKLGRLSFDYSRLRQFLCSWEKSAFRGTISKKDNSINEKSETKDKAAHKLAGDAVEIRLEHVGFTYPGSTKPTIKDINVTLRQGERIALVGLNGAGKSTLVKLLCGLYRPTQGLRFLSMEDHRKNIVKKEYFSLLAVVFQDVKLLPMTIAQNVASDVGTHIDRERVRECLTLSGLWQKVSSLPQKEDTPLGASILDDGIALSGGENRSFGWHVRSIKMHRCFF
ncbi:MAG: ATP-binding cassette domain-containing protein [Lachnospiraceae bacterium]